MNFRTTLMLAVLAAAAAVVIVILHRGGEPRKDDEVTLTTRRVFPDLSDGDIMRIEIERRDTADKLVLEKHDGTWRLLEPVEARAEWRQAGAAATELANLNRGREVALSMANVQGFGLAPPVARVRFTAKDKVHEIEIGSEGGFGNDRFTYVRLPKAETAYLAKGALGSHFTAETAEYRDKKLITWGPFDVAAVSLARGEDILRAERLGPSWVISRPVSTRADGEEIRDLVGAATGLKAETFVADGTAPEGAPRYGFAAPRLVVTLEKKLDEGALEKEEAEDVTAEPKPETVTITIGGYENLEKSRAYARVSGSPTVVTIDEQKVRDLDKDLAALRDTHAVPIGAGAVTYLAIDVAGAAVAVEKLGDGRWQTVAPQKAPAETSEVDDLIDRIRELKVKEFDDGADPASETYGFAKPYATITFRHEGDASDTTVVVGRDTETGHAWALLPGTTTAGRVEAEDVRKLQTTWLDLHRRSVWEIPDVGQIASIAWTRRGETVRIVRETPGGEVAWKMTSPVEEPLDAEKVDKLADMLREVEAEKFLAPASERAAYGLDKPEVALTVTARTSEGDGEETVHVLQVAEKDGKCAAMAPGGALVFEFGKDLLDKLDEPMSKESWGEFDTDRVHRLEITGPGIDLDFNRVGKEWAVDNVPDFPVDSMRVRWLLGDLSDAKPSKVAAYAATDLAAYGLDKPQWRFRVKGLGLDRAVLISATGPGSGSYAAVEGSGRVIVLDSSNVSRLTKDKSHYRKKD